MANYNTTIHTPKGIEDAFDYLADFGNAASWDPNTTSSKCVTGTPGEVGARYDVVTEFGGREMNLTYVTIEVDRPHRIVFASGNSSTEIRDTMTFEPSSTGTAVTYDANVKPKGLTKLLDPVLTLMFKRVGDRAAEGLKRHLAAPGNP